MFKDIIRETALTTDIANEVLNNIQGDNYMGDISFTATLRALIAPRMKEGESVYVKEFSWIAPTDMEVLKRKTNMVKAIGATIDNFARPNTIYVVDVRRTKTDNADEVGNKIFANIADSFTNAYKSFVRINRVSEWYNKSFRMDCFVDENRRIVVYVVDTLSLQKWHLLQFSCLATMPWYYTDDDKASGLPEGDRALMCSLNEKTGDTYLRLLEEAAAKYDFRSVSIRRILNGFEIRHLGAQKASIERNQNSIRRRIDEYLSDVSDLNREYMDNQIRIMGIEQAMGEGDGPNEVMEYFLSNRNLEAVSEEDGVLRFICRGYLDQFSEDLAKKVIENTRSSVSSGHNTCNISPINMRKLMKAVFLDGVLKIRTCAAYQISVSGMSADALRGYSFPSSYNDCIPNTHINEYRCMGNYPQQIAEAFRSCDYIQVIEICMSSTRSLNFGDGTVMDSFMDHLYENLYRCIELPDGSVVYPVDAVKWVNENEKKEESEGAKSE